ncbi:uncharacterized protein PHACADRAFT_214876 [Phanerochaete carnosa HHB-10118-sp]|uniref:Uncharacterized protein n=1 Tax=Phanerochaete carnosa (strain HHB-10118-sp) TaxID=650164 RepID=K5WDM0_PHACS|nr:uncharacterized protein PHACADRAFT_214876 [Phanerochaete carnosa HHB-10118-sp]EKM48267.1 hypothetical protein PHACADRAFT_214876 [Phanerochaete carnosa HHB-10118-sp]
MTWILILIGFIQTALFASLRVFAIWDRSYVWSLIVFALNMVQFATNVIFPKHSFIVYPLVGVKCVSIYRFSAQTTGTSRPRVVYITRGSAVLADAIVLVLTWIKTFGRWKQARRLNAEVSLTACFLRDGTIFFIALVAMNIAQLLTFDFSADLSPMSSFISTLPPVLINRFLINLRTVDSEALDINDRQQEQSSIRFRRSTNRLGNIGETLQDGWSDEPRNEENGSAEVGGEGHREVSATI